METPKEVDLVMLSVLEEKDGELMFQSGFSPVLHAEMSDEERESVNAVIDQLFDLIEPVFMRIADEAFADEAV